MTLLIAITQRVDVIQGRDERRDALDQRWVPFLSEAGLSPLIVPNDPVAALTLVEKVLPAGLILSGGNDLMTNGGNAPERDETEMRLVAWARGNRLPIMAVCRGMQFLATLLGGRLVHVSGHVKTSHTVKWESHMETVNSYHNWGIEVLPPGMLPTAFAPDGTIEAFRHKEEPLEGIMWHPERDPPFRTEDVARFARLFTSRQ